MTNNGRVVPFERRANFYSKMGVKLVVEQRFAEAAKLFEKAISLDEQNCEHRFNLAGALSEMDNIKESVSILEAAINTLDEVMPDCYFALGCNYFDLGEYNKSRESFEKYCKVAPIGNFSLEANEAIRFIDSNILNKKKSRQEKIQKLAKKGKLYLEKFQLDKAIRLLEKITLIDDQLTIPRNNLSLAYFLSDRIGDAVHTAREVLKINKFDPYANCNLALYYKTMDSIDLYKNQLEGVKDASYDSTEEILNAVDILYKLGEDNIILFLLERYTSKHDEIILRHFLAIAYHNVERIEKAVNIWEDLKNKLPYMTIFADCFIMETAKVIKNPNAFSTMEYDVKVFADYMKRIQELVDLLLRLDQREFNNTWESNTFVKDVVEYYLYKLDKTKKLNLIDKLANIDDDEAIDLLDKYVKSTSRKDEVSSKCEQVVIKKRVAGDAMANIVEISSKLKK